MSSTPTRKSATERRQQISDASIEIALSSGLTALTMRAVAARIGSAPTLVVHHVESMESLVADTFERIVSSELADVIELTETHKAPAAKLEATLRTSLDGSRNDVTRVWLEAWVQGQTNAELATRVRNQMDAWRQFIATLIQLGCDEGTYQAHDPLMVAGQVLGMIDGLNAHSLVGWQSDDNRIDLMLRAVEAMLTPTQQAAHAL